MFKYVLFCLHVSMNYPVFSCYWLLVLLCFIIYIILQFYNNKIYNIYIMLIFLLAILIPACASSSTAFLMMYSAYMLNKQGDNIQPWHTPFPIWNQSNCSMSSSNCCFLTCIQISQEAGQVVWYSHLFQNFPQFIVIHTVKGFGIVNKAEIDIFPELSCFSHDSADVGNLISGSSAFSKTSLNIWVS